MKRLGWSTKWHLATSRRDCQSGEVFFGLSGVYLYMFHLLAGVFLLHIRHNVVDVIEGSPQGTVSDFGSQGGSRSVKSGYIFLIYILIFSVCSNKCCWRGRDAANEFEFYHQRISNAVTPFRSPITARAIPKSRRPEFPWWMTGGKKRLGCLSWKGTVNYVWWQRSAITARKRLLQPVQEAPTREKYITY